MNNIVEFLIKAKKATYAGKGSETDPSRPASHDLRFAEGELLYLDTYLGGERFAGEEALWKNGEPFWAMNYVGRTVSEGFDGNFLKEALSNVPFDMPYRGPAQYQSGSFLYKCSVRGDFGWFSGHEEIFSDDIKVFECTFHGGEIR